MVEAMSLFNKTNIIHITTSVSRRLNILCIMFKIITFFITKLIYVSVGTLLIRGKHLHDHIMSLRGEEGGEGGGGFEP